MRFQADVEVAPSSRDTTRQSEKTRFEAEAIPYMRQLYPAALRLTHDRASAEDLIQETFTRAFVKFGQFTPGSNLRAWLYRIMFCTFCSNRRRQARRPAELLADGFHDMASRAAATSTLTARIRSAEAEALDNLALSPVMRALAELPCRFKTVVWLADVHGYHYNEIARIMGTPVGTVMSRIHRGRKMLRSKLTETRPPAIPAARPDAADAPAPSADVTRSGADGGTPEGSRVPRPASSSSLATAA